MLEINKILLIEPYWNVKSIHMPREAARLFSFNRTILECKAVINSFKLTFPKLLIEPYWNVKDDKYDVYAKKVFLLIEPYWNVKEKLEEALLNPDTTFNRTILECKGHYCRFKHFTRVNF